MVDNADMIRLHRNIFKINENPSSGDYAGKGGKRHLMIGRLFYLLTTAITSILINSTVNASNLAQEDTPILVTNTAGSINRMRGAMVRLSSVSKEDIENFSLNWKGNIIRVPLYMLDGADEPSNPNYVETSDVNYIEKVWSKAFEDLDRVLDLSEEYNLKVIVDMHGVPYKGLKEDFWDNPVHFDLLVKTWQVLAERLLGRGDVIFGYDLLNEPSYCSPAEWQVIAQRIANAIREIDSNRTLIMQSALGANPAGFNALKPLDNENVIYSVHMYLPHAFTHQNLHADSSVRPEYPGKISTKSWEFTRSGDIEWDKNILKESLKPVVDFQDTYNVRILVGEFSAIRWAPGAYEYIRDVLEIFEGYGWDWVYHAYRESNLWSVEYTPNRSYTLSVSPNKRELLLRDWLGQNEYSANQTSPPASPSDIQADKTNN